MILLRSKPLRQFFQVGGLHLNDKLITMNAMDGENVVFVENDLVALA